MSNEISLFQQSVPDYIKEADIDELTKSLGGSGGMKRISIRGRVFRMMVNGEEIAKNESNAMNIVVVNGTKHVARKFYAGKYTPGENAAPDCWSNDGATPDASIEKPQHGNCEGCPQNIKGSGQGDSRACRYEKRLAVVLADDIKGSVYQLILPSKSYFGKGDLDKMPFEQYAKYVASQGWFYCSFFSLRRCSISIKIARSNIAMVLSSWLIRLCTSIGTISSRSAAVNPTHSRSRALIKAAR